MFQKEIVSFKTLKPLLNQQAEAPEKVENYRDLEAELSKSTSFGKTKRFFVLKGPMLTYYRTRQQYLQSPSNYQESYDLPECEIQSIEEGNTSFKIKITSKTSRLSVQKSLTIFYKERATFEAWLSAINFSRQPQSQNYQDILSEDFGKSILKESFKITQQNEDENHKEARRYPLPVESRKQEPSLPDSISLTVNKENIIYLSHKPFLSVIFETNAENTFVTPKSTQSKFADKLLLSSENLAKTQELYTSPSLQNNIIFPTYQPKKYGRNLNHEDNQTNLDLNPTGNEAFRFYERVFKAINHSSNGQTMKYSVPNQDIKFDELLMKLKKDMEDIFTSCHEFQNIEKFVEADEPLTYALECLQKLIDESYLANISLKDFKKILIVIEENIDYYLTLLDNKARQLISIAKGSDLEVLPSFFYKECLLYSNEFSKIQSMYKAHFQRLFGILDHPPVALSEKTASADLFHVFFNSELDFRKYKDNGLEARERLIEMRFHKKFLTSRALKAMLMFLKDHAQQNGLGQRRSIRIYGV